MDRKNIMYIFNDASFGGATQSLLDTLARIKNDVNPVVIIRDDTPVEDKFIELGIRYYKIRFSTDYVKIGNADNNKRVYDIKQSYQAAVQLLPIIEKEKIQLIHINSSTSYFAAIAALMAKIPYIWHIRELMKEQFGCESLNEELKISLYKKADKLIAISDYVKNQYCEKYGIDTIKVYNGLDIARFKRQEVNNPQTNNTFIVASMISPEKGQWDVIRATELLMERGYNDINIVIVGEGIAGYVWALKKYIKRKRLENNIYMLPFHDDLSELRSKATYAITSSQNEALGRVTIEAMLAGNVVIGAKSGGTAEIIGVNEERGFLYELGNSKSLADTMIRAMDSTAETKELIMHNAQQYAETTFDSRKYCDEMVKIYDEVIKSYQPYEYSKFLYALKEYQESVKIPEKPQEKQSSFKKDSVMLSVVLKWLEIRQEGHLLDEYFKQRDIHSIAIYGMGALGCRLYDELENSDIEVKYLLDRNPNGMDKVFKFASLDKEILDVDAVIVTVVSGEKQIVNEIRKQEYKNVTGLSEIINSFDKF